MKKFELINHTADIGIKVEGDSLKEVFKNLAVGMFEIMVDIKPKRGKSISDKIEITSPDLISLAHDWLGELLYIFNTKHIVFNKFKINNITEFSLNAKITGELFNPEKHVIKKEIKAVTYHGLKIESKNNRWVGQVIFDI